jgi:hypothetical protein
MVAETAQKLTHPYLFLTYMQELSTLHMNRGREAVREPLRLECAEQVAEAPDAPS